jgi:hypothetical protein
MDAELVRMIERRASKEPHRDESEELWKESVRRYNARNRAEMRAAWREYHQGGRAPESRPGSVDSQPRGTGRDVQRQTERKPSMTNNIAEIEQGANEALSENRRELAEETAQINREPDLSEEAKARYVGEARERAQAKYVRIIDVHDQAIRDGNR